MIPKKSLAIIGSGASAVYLLKHFLDHAKTLVAVLPEITIYEKKSVAGIGMPYSAEYSDRTNMANIPSEEMAPLLTPLVEWLESLDTERLAELDIRREDINERKIYSRIALGQYLRNQYSQICGRLREHGFQLTERLNCPVLDVEDDAASQTATVVTEDGSKKHDIVVIATGHRWSKDDLPANGYYASPWPIAKLLPPTNSHFDFPIGTLGASLSAFDVIAALSERHGAFLKAGSRFDYQAAAGTEKFKIIMHASHGRLPHLRYSIENFERKIYQHVSSEELFGLVDENGFLRLETYFDAVCRPVLQKAFRQDKMEDVAVLLEDEEFLFEDFIEKMNAEHSHDDAFAGMREEMKEARDSVLGDRPIHWKEVIDDLIYTLNFHAGLMPAEDHIFLHAKVMPFLMNVIAAMPLHSAEKLLALHAAGKLEMLAGRVSLSETQEKEGETSIILEDEAGEKKVISYQMFVDCSGQKPVQIEEYPFPSLVAGGMVRKARARFADAKKANDLTKSETDRLGKDATGVFYHTGGIDIDDTYAVISAEGEVSQRIFDIAFPHSTGVRPYSYGLQSCSDTGAILTGSLLKILKKTGGEDEITEREITEIYANV